MTSLTVSVLAPNGRRQIVKCTSNTTIMQIIDEVCCKQGYEPSEYDLKHHNKILDANTILRFSGLPNNAELELAPITKMRIDSEVIVAINLENGHRVIGNFLPDENLSNIINTLCPNELNDSSIIIYTRREIYGDNLKLTTLRSLGLTSGRALFRLDHRNLKELKNQANVSIPLPSKPNDDNIFIKPTKINKYKKKEINSTVIERKDTPRPKEKKADVDYVKLAKEKKKLHFSPEKNIKGKFDIKNNKRTDELMDVDIPIEDNKNNTNLLSDKTVEMEFVYVGERNAMIFSLETAEKPKSEDLPDEFFDLTIDDAKTLLRDVRKRNNEMENAPLLTSALRELEKSKKQLQLNKYKKAIIRIQFPNRIILQGLFNPIETIEDVINFIKIFLEYPKIDLYLYTTPPKNILSIESKLIDIDCVPTALLHLGSTNNNQLSLNIQYLSKLTTNSLASLAANRMRQKYTRITSADDDDDDDDKDGSNSKVLDNDFSIPGPSNYYI